MLLAEHRRLETCMDSRNNLVRYHPKLKRAEYVAQ